MKGRDPLFSVTASDCNWQFVRGSGKGGQARNKTSNAVRCTHKASGATAFCQDGRSQKQNRIEAFKKMSQTPEFKKWHAYEVARRTGQMAEVDKWVADQMRDHVLVEVKDDQGNWTQEGGYEHQAGA